EAFLSGCARPAMTSGDGVIRPASIPFFDEVGETILPATAKSPGAKAAKIGDFMNIIVTDCYTESDQAVFGTAESLIDEASQVKYGRNFLDTTPTERHDLLVQIDAEATAYNEARGVGD